MSLTLTNMLCIKKKVLGMVNEKMLIGFRQAKKQHNMIYIDKY